MRRDITVLRDMLTYRRPHASRSEAEFRERFLLSIPGAYVDTFGNIHVSRLATPSRTLWSAHTDTVHTRAGRQVIRRGADDVWELARGEQASNCLGADDAVGCYVLRTLALANVPGWYVFHANEEHGGVGSSALARSSAVWLAGHFDRAIAIDRRGQSDIITHQAGSRCCSDDFAAALAAVLGMGHAPSRGGVYTDTAEYTDNIGECTNISAGYQHEHSRGETVDFAYVSRLTDALLAADVEALPVIRHAGEYEPTYRTSSWSGHFTSYDFQHDDIADATFDSVGQSGGFLDSEVAAVRRYLLYGLEPDDVDAAARRGVHVRDDGNFYRDDRRLAEWEVDDLLERSDVWGAQ